MKSNIRYVIPLLDKSFTSVTMKDAYMKAVKWYASNVLAKDELHNILVEYEKGNDELQSPTITAHLFISISEQEVRSEHCNICKEFHNSFFINNKVDCNNCKMAGYINRLDKKAKSKYDYYKHLIF